MNKDKLEYYRSALYRRCGHFYIIIIYLTILARTHRSFRQERTVQIKILTPILSNLSFCFVLMISVIYMQGGFVKQLQYILGKPSKTTRGGSPHFQGGTDHIHYFYRENIPFLVVLGGGGEQRITLGFLGRSKLFVYKWFKIGLNHIF